MQKWFLSRNTHLAYVVDTYYNKIIGLNLFQKAGGQIFQSLA